MSLKKHLNKIIFLTIIILFFIVFAISNNSKVIIEIFQIKESFKIWILVLYSILLGSIITILFILPSIINLNSRHKSLREKFEILSDEKLSETIKTNDDIIE